MQNWKCLLAALALLGVSCTEGRQFPKGASWNAGAATFSWNAGQVKLPAGFTYQIDQGADSYMGHFTSPDGKLVIYHDIGPFAGTYAHRDRSFFFREQVIDGARVWIAKRDWPSGKGTTGGATFVAATFPDSGCANFYLVLSRPEDAAQIELIANSFRPKGRVQPGCPLR